MEKKTRFLSNIMNLLFYLLVTEVFRPPPPDGYSSKQFTKNTMSKCEVSIVEIGDRRWMWGE